MQRTRVALALLALLALFVAFLADRSTSSGAERPTPAAATRVEVVDRLPVGLPTYPIEAGEIDAGLVARYAQTVARDDVGRYLAELIEQDRVAAEETARRNAQVSAPAVASAPVSGGDCSGFPLPASIIQRESGFDPNAVNPSSGTFGCAQLQPFHFADGGACSGLSTDKAGQIACTYELQRRAGMSPWAL